jgi:hypothetical protein
MASVYDKYYENQPAAVKVIAVAGLGLLGYTLYRSIKRKQDEADALRAAQSAASDLQNLQAQGVVPSYTDTQFLTWVNALVQAMNGCGTDNEMIYDVFDWMENEADLKKLMVSFGIQYYEPCWLHSPLESAIWQFNDKAYGGDLTTWLYYDLTTSEIGKINSILRGKGINFQF